jgi:hypothetical protein
MARKTNARGRAKKGRFAGIPHSVMESESYYLSSGNALKLLLELAKQYNGYNNGDLSAAFSVLKSRGWRSKKTLARCLAELIERELIVRTREGWFSNPGGRCALYGLTWLRIDECDGKDLEVGPTASPYRSFGAENFKKPGSEIATSPTPNVYRIRPRDKTGQYCSS